METAEAVAKVEEWLRAVHGARGVRVDHGKVRRVPEGWSVPYNSVAFLDGGDAGKAIFPPPRLVVREPDGQLREASPQPGGLSIPARTPGEVYWAEIVDPEVAASGLGYLGVPERAIGGWSRVEPDGTRAGVERVNDRYRSGPLRLGFLPPANPLEWMLLFAAVGWFDDDRLLTGLTQTDVLVPRTGLVGKRTADWYPVYSSTRHLPADTTEWRRVDLASLVAGFPEPTRLTFYSPAGPRDVSTVDLADALQRFPRLRPPVDVPESRFEVGEEPARLAKDMAAKLGLRSPADVPVHEARYARANGFELTDDEIRRTVVGKSWQQLVHETGDPQRWPAEADLAANGLQPVYDDDGRITPQVDAYGKYCIQASTGFRYGYGRVTGAFVGFALGEALGRAVDTLSRDEIREHYGPHGVTDLVSGEIGPLTQRLLFLTEGAIRSPHGRAPDAEAVLADAATGGLLRWLHTQGDTVPREIDGWLVRVADLYADRLPDADELAAIRDLALGRTGTGSGPAALLAALPAALTEGGPGTGLAQGPRAAARAIAALTTRSEEDIAATEYLTGVFQIVLEDKVNPTPLWLAGRDVQVPGVDVVSTLPDYGKFGLVDAFSPDEMGAGRDTTTVLRQAFSAIAGFEHKPERALVRAVNHSGRSAFTGALAGALLGARVGIPGLPARWLERLELRHLVENLATDAFRHFNRASPLGGASGHWTTRYPRT
ncbi:ADP-ribosylglycohydrolase family protein [Saccharothrix sp. NRRL B-16314]|uniref:ADP-ribosylglycohydrolase family protein n=1 Tax=Saccharothrix sp. NRRL B-16314 TaxID=1463825 RepID=UPI000524D3F6|nr:ADP-ribosylglycohydrolase family protein [Saccharothrix sp. NRRL B-16314]